MWWGIYLLIGYWISFDAISMENFRYAARQFDMENVIDKCPKWVLIMASFIAIMCWPIVIALAIYGAMSGE